jgi:hypothetical protein
MEKKGHLNPNSSLAPNGVDYARYAVPWTEPADLGAIPRPRIGYVGIIKAQLDFDLLLTLARRHRDWSFVFVGPRELDGEASPPNSFGANVHFWRQVPADLRPTHNISTSACWQSWSIMFT